MQTEVERRSVSRDELVAAASEQVDLGGRVLMVVGHEDPDAFRVVYVFGYPRSEGSGARRVELIVEVPRSDAWVPSLAASSFAIGRFEREIRDQYGIRPEGHPLPYRLIRHGHWPQGWYPMLRDADPHPRFEADVGSFPFLEVEGEGVYEIPVGPVHAGIIEPGHFRFSVVGETILRMKARLWFVHRGVEKLFEGRAPAEGIELAERISGDTAVGHTLAYCLAVEDAAGLEVPESARLLRALLLELERLHNHVTDLGALANDVGFGVINTHAWRLREQLLRMNKQVTGHRLLRGAVQVGGCRVLELPEAGWLQELASEVQELVDVTLGHSGVRDRFVGTAVLPYAEAVALGTLGYVARASGVDVDARRDYPFVDLGAEFTSAVESGGDVRSRYIVRAREYAASTALAVDLLGRLGGRESGQVADEQVGAGAGVGIVEAWRGLLVHRVELDGNGQVTRVKVVDPSFFNWPALPVALADTIVPDFPLANKSFNQSYAGNDL